MQVIKARSHVIVNKILQCIAFMTRLYNAGILLFKESTLAFYAGAILRCPIGLLRTTLDGSTLL